jgi:crotonobetainyl-CoA:carnitine CoA-transferase CaiB-like acyl-CoA transferase
VHSTAFAGIRVLELTTGQAGRTAGMLLADLGADVVRVGAAGGTAPQDLCWDRGKRLVTGDVDRLAAAADLVIGDGPHGPPRGRIQLWMPPYAATGRWAGLPDHPLLLGAVGGFAGFHPSTDGGPVASVVPLVAAVHGALGAAAAAAALLSDHEASIVVSGLHASALCLGSVALEGMDVDRIVSSGTRLPGSPNFRVYRAGDGRWLQLAALTPGLFFVALEVLDLMHLMAAEGVDGEFTNLLLPEVGARVGRELEAVFATRPRDEWISALNAAGVPVAPIQTRSEWLADDLVTTTGMRLEVEHPELGPVTLPGVPVRLPATPGVAGRLGGTAVPAAEVWPDGPRERAVPPGPAPARPLAGLRVVDLSTFLAAPLVAGLLADLGAEVVKVEPPTGDPYRIFSASHAWANQGKTIGQLDLRSADVRADLVDLLREADVLVDNLRPVVAGRLGLGDEVLAKAGEHLVRCSVSAFGRTGPQAERPGFDPLLQALSGLSDAQGGADLPVPTAAPVLDVCTGALGAFGVLAALHARRRSGHGQHVTLSLATTSTFLQAAELTSYAGRPPLITGSRDFRGPTPGQHYYRAADGWLAVAATTPEQEAALSAATGPDIGAAVAQHPVEHWLDVLAADGVPAATVLVNEGALHDPFLVANHFSHIVQDPLIGRVRVARGYSDWPGRPEPVPGPGWASALELLKASSGPASGATASG